MATPEAAARAPASGLLRLSDAIARVRWVAVLRLLLGALFVSVFFENLEKKLYTERGYAALINGYADSPKATGPGLWRDEVMPFFADNAAIFAPVQAAFELSLGIVLTLGIATGAVALITAGHLTALWISELGIFWVWELLSLIVVAVVVGLTALPRLLDSRRPLSERVLGPPTFTTMSMPARVVVAVLCGLGLALAILAAQTGGKRHYESVALEAGIVFGVLVLLLAVLDRRRVPDGAPGP
jgi:hypothetical protein